MSDLRRIRGGWLGCLVTLIGWGWALPAQGQIDYEGAPIHYGKGESQDRVAKLASALESGELKLEVDERWGYLPSVMKALEIPAESQTLVFSKTSFQLHKIDPERPRAVYFNDDTYLGWVRGGEVLELAATDPDQGAMFYTLETQGPAGPRVVKDQGQCLICHGTLRTQGVPGYLIRSVYCNPAGRFVSGTPAYVTDHASPFAQRWGGWFVTGTHGSMKHLGNVLCEDETTPGWIDPEAGLNQTKLPERVQSAAYYRPHSDLVALMVMEHQSQMHNLITRANFEARTAAHQDTGINTALGRPADFQSDSTKRRIASIGERLVRYMLMADEYQLESAVAGTSGFTEAFSNRGPRDRRGRSLYALDLQQRLFKYPCSYLIYSPAFDALPQTMLEYVGARMHAVLVSGEPVEGYERLSPADRRAVAEILLETKPAFWRDYVLDPPVKEANAG